VSLTPGMAPRSLPPTSMRGRRRTVASILAQTLSSHPEARVAAAAAAFADACGHPLCRETSVRGFTADGRLLVLARSVDWARQLEAFSPMVCARMNARLGPPAVAGLAVRIGNLEP
jgi:hypothetical protein